MTLISRTEPQSREAIIAEMKTMRPHSERWKELFRIARMMTLAGIAEEALLAGMRKEAGDDRP